MVSKRAQLPIIALVGQTNSGKSSLFNLLVKSQRAVTAKEPGTTRDLVDEVIYLDKDRPAWLFDTAGLKQAEDDFEQTIQSQITDAICRADIIVLLVEAQRRLTSRDRQLAKQILKQQKPTLLVANKWDLNHRAQLTDFQALGIRSIKLLSTTTRQGLADVIQALSALVPKKSFQIDQSGIVVALIGRPNVGKSSLFNSLVDKQQALVSEQAGTTRDINRRQLRYKHQTIELLDTAGIRRPGKVSQGVEKFSIMRTLIAIKEADICLLLIDANQVGTHLEQKIAGLVKTAQKGLVLTISKWDSLKKDDQTAPLITRQLQQEFDFVPWAPLIFTSASTDHNVKQVLELVYQIHQRQNQLITTAKLNRWLLTAVNHHPPAGYKNFHPQLKYITQTSQSPPTFTFWGRATEHLHWSYKRFLERRLRQQFDLVGVSVQLKFKNSLPKAKPD